jgi:hypothetical protein
MSETRPRLAKWIVVGCLATVGVLLVLLFRADTGLPPAEKQSRRPAKAGQQPLSVATESVREPVSAGLQAVAATSDHRGTARILALDDNLRPVPTVEIWLATRPTRGDGYEVSPQNLRGVTGVDGVIELGDLPEGKYMVHARHEMLVHSHRRRSKMQLEQPHAVLMIGSTRADLTVYLSMPVVCAVEIVGRSIFYDSFYESGAGYHTPSNWDGKWSCQRIKERLQEAFPGSVCNVRVKNFQPPARSGRYGSCLVTAWAVGHEAFREELLPIPLDLFVGPVQIQAWNLRPSDQFGTIRITVNGAGGMTVDSLRFTIGTPMALWRHDLPEVHFLRLVTGEPVTVPVGTYDLTCEGEFPARHPALSRRSLKVERGELTDVVIDSAIPWSRCRLSFHGAGEERPLKGGIIVLKHVESSISVTKLISHFDPPIELWLPDGEYVIRAEAYSSNREMIWRHEDEVVLVRGGSLESPQLVAREMVLVKR